MSSLALVAVGCLALVGWALNIPLLKSVLPRLTPMKPNTAVLFLFVGLILWLNQDIKSIRNKRLAQIGASLVLIISGLTLAEHIWGWNLGIDQILFQEAIRTTALANMGRMAQITAVSFVLLGTALLMLIDQRHYRLTQFLALLVFGIGLLAFAGYLFDVSSLYDVSLFSAIALPTAVAFCVAGMGVLLACSREGFITDLSGNNLGSVMARRLLPAVIIVPLVIGWLRLQGQLLGYYDTQFGLALFAISNIIILTIVVWVTARALNRIDVEHQHATANLERYGHRMEILHNIDRGIIAAQAIPDLIDITLKELRILVPCQRITIVLVDEATHELVNFGSEFDQGHSIVAARVPIPPRIFEGFDADNIRLIKDLRLFPASKPLVDVGMVTMLQALLMRDHDPIGLLNLSSSTDGFFTPEYREIVIEVAHQLAIVLNQMRLTETVQKSNVQLERYARRMEILHNIDRGIIASHEIRQLTESTIKELRMIIPCQRIAFSLVDETGQALQIYTVDTNLDNPFNSERLPLLPDFFDGFDSDGTRLFDDLRLVQGHFQFADVLLERGFLTLLQVKVTQDDHPVGIVHLAATTVGFFTSEHRQVVIEVADQLVIAIKQMRLLDNIQKSNVQLERYARRMELLHNIDRGIIASQATPELIETTLIKLRQIIPCQSTAVSLVNQAAQELMVYTVDVEHNLPLNVRPLPFVPGLWEGFDDDNIRIFEDLNLIQDRFPIAKNLIAQNLFTLLQVRLMQDGQPVGIMSLASPTPGFFTPEYREIAGEIANQLTVALKQVRLSEHIQEANIQLERFARRMEILHNIDRGIIASQDVNQLIESTLKEVRSLIPCDHLSMSLVDQAAQELVIYAYDGERILSLNVTRIPLLPKLWEGFDQDNARVFADLRLLPNPNSVVKDLLEQNLVAFLQVRMMQDGEPVGTVNLSSSIPGFFTFEYREIAVEVSSQLAIAIKQMRLSEALQEANDTLEQRVIERTAQLNTAKEQVEAILNNSLDGLLLANLDLSIKKVNPAFEKLFGHTLAENGTLSLLDVIDTSDAKPVTASVQTALKEEKSNTIEVRGRRENGSTFDAEISIGHIEGDGLVATIHDITDRKAQERQLRYKAGIQNTVADAVIVTDLEFRIQSWNKAAERIYGWREDEVVGKYIRELLQTEFSSSQFADEIRRLFIEQGHWSGEVLQRRRDGSPIYILSSSVLFKDQGNVPFGVLAVNHDISERKQAENMLRTALEREKELGEMKTRFISVASHEFRTPLTAILLATESVKHYRNKMTPEQIDLKLDKVHQQVEHMTSILEDVLQSARMQDNYVDFKPAQENFDAVCRDLVQEFAERPEFSGRIHFTSDVPNLVFHFDSRLMRQVIINLLSNALKYSPVDQPVQVGLTQQGEHLNLTVSDQGIGIPADDLKHIFEPFHRAGNVGKISGTGLGMSISKKAVEMHGGSISVTSEVGQGTTFTVNIPIKLA